MKLLQWTNDLIAKGTASEIIARTIERDPDAASKALRQADATLTTLRLGAAGEQSFDNPDWVKFLLYDNTGFTRRRRQQARRPRRTISCRCARRCARSCPIPQHAVMAAVLVGNAPLDDLAAGSDAVKDAFDGRTFDNASVIVTGTPTFLTDINDYLQGGMLTLGGIAVRGDDGHPHRRVPGAVAPAAAWSAWSSACSGASARSGSPARSCRSSPSPACPILIGLGIEFSIQVHNRIEEERTIERVADPYGQTLSYMGPPLLAATIAAVIAFLTVKISKVPMVQDFGVLLSIGIVALLVAGIVLPLTHHRRPRTALAVHQRAPKPSWVEATVRRLGSLPRGAVLPLVIIAVAIPVLGLALEGGTKIESDPINWANQEQRGHPERPHAREARPGSPARSACSCRPTRPCPPNGVFTDQMGAFQMDLVEGQLAENPELAQASSLATTVGWLAEVPGGHPAAARPASTCCRPTTSRPTRCRRCSWPNDGNAAQVLFQVGPSSLEERVARARQRRGGHRRPGRRRALLPLNATATTGGLAVVGVGLLENITANRAELTIVAVLLVAAFIILRYRDLARGLLTMIPVLLAVGMSAVLVRALNITLSPLTTVGGPLVVATCAEFSVLLVDRYAEQRDAWVRPGGEQPGRRRAHRSGVLHLGAHHARRVRRADVQLAAAAGRLRHGRHHQHRGRAAGRARGGAAAGEGGRPPPAAGDGPASSGWRRQPSQGGDGAHERAARRRSAWLLVLRASSDTSEAAAAPRMTDDGRGAGHHPAVHHHAAHHLAGPGRHAAARPGRAPDRAGGRRVLRRPGRRRAWIPAWPAARPTTCIATTVRGRPAGDGHRQRATSRRGERAARRLPPSAAASPRSSSTRRPPRPADPATRRRAARGGTSRTRRRGRRRWACVASMPAVVLVLEHGHVRTTRGRPRRRLRRAAAPPHRVLGELGVAGGHAEHVLEVAQQRGRRLAGAWRCPGSAAPRRAATRPGCRRASSRCWSTPTRPVTPWYCGRDRPSARTSPSLVLLPDHQRRAGVRHGLGRGAERDHHLAAAARGRPR